MVILFLILAIGFSVGLIYSLQKILFRGELIYLLYFFCLYLPFYATLQAIFFKYTGSFEVVFLTKYLKEILVFISLVSWILYRRDILSHPIKLNLPDYLFLIFVLYALLYTLFPIGPSSFLNKAIYFKNILMLALMYGFGRLIILSKSQSQMLLKLIMGVAIGAFFVNLGERAFGIHFQNLIGYVDWNLSFNGTEPSGHYGLLYTFGSPSAKRLAAFFANPLELASSMILSFSVALGLFLSLKRKVNQYKYLSIMAVSLGSLLFAYSRGPFIGFFLLIFFTAIVLGYYRLIIVGSISVLVLALFAFFFSGEDTRFLLIDTFNLADPSSAGHVIAWLEGLESMVTQPFGIGLATSGNASGVESDLQIGGENQFVIFGVQLGVPFLLVYILLLGTVINYSIKAYRVAKGTGYEVIPFVASTFKVAFLIPLFTANAEIYLYVAYISWWMAGQSVSIYESGESLGKPLKGAL